MASMAVPTSLVLASEVIGFLSFGFTLLTALGVYADLIKTLRGAPASIPITLGNLREEIRYEQLLCKRNIAMSDRFHILPGSRHGRHKKKQDVVRLLMNTLRHLWTEFCDLERRFLINGERPTPETASDTDSADEKPSSRHRRPKPAPKQSYIRSRMGWIEAGLARDRQTYYNTDLAHRFLWWWKKDDVNNLAQQIQRIQIRRIERDAYETDVLVKRGLRIYGRVTGMDVYNDSDGDGDDGSGGGGGSGSDDGGGRGGGRQGGGYARHARRRRHSGMLGSRGNGVRVRSRNGSVSRGGTVREVSEKEVVRRRAPSPEHVPPRRPSSVAESRRSRVPRGSVVYEYEVVDPGRIHVEYEGPRQGQARYEDRRRSYSRHPESDADR